MFVRDVPIRYWYRKYRKFLKYRKEIDIESNSDRIFSKKNCLDRIDLKIWYRHISDVCIYLNFYIIFSIIFKKRQYSKKFKKSWYKDMNDYWR